MQIINGLARGVHLQHAQTDTYTGAVLAGAMTARVLTLCAYAKWKDS